MKIVFFGSGSFAVPILTALQASRHDLVGIVTQPDRKKGRHLRLAPTPVKEEARASGATLLQPEDIRSACFLESLTAFEADIFVVVSYGCILPEEVLAVARKICVNVHASLLPKYRGAAPVQRALMAGESRTGVTFIRMNRYMDRGDILLKKTTRITTADTAVLLDARLAHMAAESLPGLLARIDHGSVRPVKQDERKATYAAKLKKEDGRLDWSLTNREVFNRHRGCSGWPGSFATFRGKRLNITELSLGKNTRRDTPGLIVKTLPDALEVACGKGTVLIKEVTPESQPKMSAYRFISTFQVQEGEILGSASKIT